MLFGKKINKYFICKVSIFLLLILASTNFVYAENGVPSTISYQGHLSDSGGNLLGGVGTPYYFKFSFWDSPTVGSGNKVWPSSSPTATSLTVRQGVFSVNIGDVANGYPDTLDYDFNSNKNVYLQVEISSDNSTFETLSPRSSITSSAFSKVTDRVSGTAQSSFGTTTPITNSLISAITTGINQVAMTIKGLAGQVANLFNIQDSTGNSLFSVTADGKVGVGTSTPSAALTLGSGQLLVPNGNSSLPSLVGHNSTLAGIYFSGGTTVITAANGATPNYTNLTVNTAGVGTNRSFISTGNGSASAPIFISNYDLNTGIFSPANDMWAVTTGGTERLRINDFGNIGIGVTNPVASLNLATSTGGFIVGTTTAQSTIYNGIFGPTTATAGNTLFAVKSIGTMGNGGSIFTALTSGGTGLRVTESGGVYMSSNVQMTGGPVTLALGGNTNTNTISSSNSGAALNTDFLFKAGSADRTAGNLFQVSNFTNPVLTISALTGTGNVGIGTTTPGSKLDVWGNLNIGTSSTPAFFVDTGTGYVGVGTTQANLGAKFQVGSGANRDQLNGGYGDFRRNGYYLRFDANTGGTYSNFGLLSSNSPNGLGLGGALDTAHMVISSLGNVGIGTTTPDNPLNIYFNSSNTYLPGVKLQNANSSGKALFSAQNNLGKSLSMGIFGSGFGVGLANTATLSGSDGIVLMTDGEVANGGTNSIQFRTGGYNTTQERMRIDYLGKVGIGTTNPYDKLEVSAAGSGALGGRIVISNSAASALNNSSELGFKSGATFGNGYYSGAISVKQIGELNNNNAMIFRVYGVDGVAEGAERMRITSTGNIGIGTTTPSSVLTVNGTGSFYGGDINIYSSNQSPTGTGRITWGPTINGGSGALQITSGSTGFYGYGMTAHSASAGMTFGARGGSFNVTSDTGTNLTVLTGGNVGIGTTTPSSKLTIGGNLFLTGGIYDNNYSLGSSGNLMQSTGSGFNWVSSSSLGFGDTIGATSSTDNAIARFDLTTGKLIKNSSVTIDNSGNMNLLANTSITGANNFSIKATAGSVYTLAGTYGVSVSSNGNMVVGTNSGGGAGVNGTISGFNPGGSNQTPRSLTVRGGNALASETTSSNRLGESLYLKGGNSAASATIAAPGGNVYLDGGVGTFGGSNGNIILGSTTGYVGIGAITPSAQLHTTGTVRFGALTGAGANLIVDTDGNVTVSSDERLKNIQSNFIRGLVDIKKINPIVFKWKSETGYDTTNDYTGFSAQNIQLAIPEAVGVSSNGFLNLADRPILAAVVNAVKELAQKIESVAAWFGEDGSKFDVKGDVCVDNICVTKDQFKQLLIGSGGSISVVEENSNVVIPTETSTTTSGETTPDTAPESAPVSEPEVMVPEVISEPEPVAPIDNPEPDAPVDNPTPETII